jgi:molybdopterin-binding protein
LRGQKWRPVTQNPDLAVRTDKRSLENCKFFGRNFLVGQSQRLREGSYDLAVELDAVLAGEVILSTIATTAIEQGIKRIASKGKRGDASTASDHFLTVLPTPR